MKRVTMCFSALQASRCASAPINSWFRIFTDYRSVSRNISGVRVSVSRAGRFEDGNKNKGTRKPLNTKAEGAKKATSISKSSNRISEDISDGPSKTSAKVSIKNAEISESQSIQFCDIKPKISESKDLASLVTVIVFDIETTGLSRDNERIIEIALLDIAGGENSTFQTLVNPERYVANSYIHGISSHQVNRPEVPRMKDLIPILLQYVRSRQKPGGLVMLVAHNALRFDVPFVVNEFRRCFYEIPDDWIFLDTLALARKLLVPGTKATLKALLELYKIEIDGSPHRAMYDVMALSKVLQKLTFDLKLPISGLLKESFRVSDLSMSKKKNT